MFILLNIGTELYNYQQQNILEILQGSLIKSSVSFNVDQNVSYWVLDES